MVVSSRSIGVSSYSFRSFFFSLLAIGFVVALFFIPEILQFKKTVSGTEKAASGMKTLKIAHKDQPGSEQTSELSRISSLMESGYLDKKPASKTAGEDADTKQAATKAEAKPPLLVSDPSKQPLTWRILRGAESRRALRLAQTQISNLAESLPGDRRGSSLALYSFGSLISKVIDSKIERNYTPIQTLTAMESAYSKVLKEFIDEGVDPISYKRFVGIDFGPVARDWSPKLAGAMVPFNPHLTLTELRISKPKHNQPDSSFETSMRGYVVGGDVSKIEMISGGIRLGEIPIKKEDSEGYRDFRVKQFNLTGKVLFKVTDRSGRVFQKLYSFYPRLRLFEDGKGRVSVPKTASKEDTRLDRFFTYKITRQDSFDSGDAAYESHGFERF